ncbi:MAG: carbohydrate ABC transporter permease [Paracoccaceae bacterium]|nr:carbohydrate ABC transporter permease [Paracoccaceae bacterium]
MSDERPKAASLSHYAVLVALALVCLGPILLMAMTSLKVQADIFASPSFWFFAPTLQNYRAVLVEDSFGRFLGNSLIVASVSTVLTLVAGAMAAYAIVRFRFRGRAVVSWATLLLRSVPLAVLAVPVFGIWEQFGLLNSLWGLILLYTAVNLPFTIWVLYGFIAQIPHELEEAALIDGCGPLRVFFAVVLPLLRPGLAAAAIFTFRIAWNEFILALVLTNRATRTLPVAASLYITDVGIEWGKLMALGVLIALPPLVVTLVAARQIIAGLTAGAVKG